MIMDGGHQAAVIGASGTIPIAAENGAADEALARTRSSSSSSSSSDETSQDPWVPIAAGGAAGATRTLSAPLSRALANLFRNPLRWFRPTHAGIGIVDTLRAKYPHSRTLRDLSNELKLAPVASTALVIPAAVANMTTGVVMFTAFEVLQSWGAGAALSGAIAGLLTSAVTVPMEAVKRAAWRVQREGEARVSAGAPPLRPPFGVTLRAIAYETHLSHLRGMLWRIFVTREIVTTAVFFGTHMRVKESMIKHNIEDRMEATTHLHVVPTVCGAISAGITTRAALIPFDVLREHYFDVAEKGMNLSSQATSSDLAGTTVSLRSRWLLPSPLTVATSLLKTVPSAVGLLTYEIALAHEKRLEAEAVQSFD